MFAILRNLLCLPHTFKQFNTERNMLYHPLLTLLLFVQINKTSSSQCATKDGINTCTGKPNLLPLYNTGGGKRKGKRTLRPKDFPLDTIFTNWTETDYVDLPYGYEQRVSHGGIQQNGADPTYSNFSVLHEVVSEEEAIEILALMRGENGGIHRNRRGSKPVTAVPLDADPDTVDGMPTHEMFLDNIELRKGNPSKANPNDYSGRDRAKLEQRAPLRRQIRLITDRIVEDKLTPFVRQHYPNICGGKNDPDRKCTPCYSLLRRYVEDERTSHNVHHDGHALVTIVVSLSMRGKDYNGGLFVATKHSERKFVGLTRGDAVVHKGDLYHGVKVLPATTRTAEEIADDEENQDQEEGWLDGEDLYDEKMQDGSLAPQRMERWSWILWYRDSTSCIDYSHEWYEECAENKNPTCELLHATKVPNKPNIPDKKVAEQVLYWNQRASDHGHGGASIKIARAYLKLLPSALKKNVTKAKELYKRAIKTSNHPDAHYGLAVLLVTKRARGKALRNAVRHLERAAEGGHAFAAFNLGLAHLYGYGMRGGRRSPGVAGEWFLYSGLPEGLWAKAMHSRSEGKEKEALAYEKRAKVMGFGAPWRRLARSKTGSGGAAGVELNLNWPSLRGGKEEKIVPNKYFKPMTSN